MTTLAAPPETADKVYIGVRDTDHELAVNVQRSSAGRTHGIRRLRHYVNHSPTGFECGYNGSGPADLALAILADHLGDPRLAWVKHQDYKRAVIARLPQDRDWRIPESAVREWCAANIADVDRSTARSYRARPLRDLGIRAIQ